MLYSCGHGISSLPCISILAFVPSFSSVFHRKFQYWSRGNMGKWESNSLSLISMVTWWLDVNFLRICQSNVLVKTVPCNSWQFHSLGKSLLGSEESTNSSGAYHHRGRVEDKHGFGRRSHEGTTWSHISWISHFKMFSKFTTSIFVLTSTIPQVLLSFDLPQEITGIDLVQTQFKIAGWYFYFDW